MIKKLILTVVVLVPTTATFAQSPVIVSNKGDKIPLSDFKIEPWNQASTNLQAKTNNQNIYQGGKVGIGDFTSNNVASSLEIKGALPSMGFINTGNNSKFEITKEQNALAISATAPTNSRVLNLFPTGSLYLGTGLNSDEEIGANSNAKFIFNGTTGNLGINLPKSGDGMPTENLDIGGNARIRTPTNGNNDGQYTKTVVAKNDGTLGYTTLTMPITHTDLNTTDAIPVDSRLTLNAFSPSNENALGTVTSRTFTLTTKSLVMITYSLSVANIRKANAADRDDGIEDGKNRRMGSYLEWNNEGGAIIPKGFETDQKMMYDSFSFTNIGSSGVISTYRLNSSTKSVILEPGTYKLKLTATLHCPTTIEGVMATFGLGTGDDFSIVSIPIQ